MKEGPGDADTSGLLEQFDRLRDTYPQQMSASLVLPLLQIVQQQRGHVTAADAGLVADYARVAPAQVIEALSWYTMLHRQPVGQHVVKVCRNIACALRGSDRLLAHVEKKLGVGGILGAWTVRAIANTELRQLSEQVSELMGTVDSGVTQVETRLNSADHS
jgi:hypothetical protein